jgi:hypothetical protein
MLGRGSLKMLDRLLLTPFLFHEQDFITRRLFNRRLPTVEAEEYRESPQSRCVIIRPLFEPVPKAYALPGPSFSCMH